MHFSGPVRAVRQTQGKTLGFWCITASPPCVSAGALPGGMAAGYDRSTVRALFYHPW